MFYLDAAIDNALHTTRFGDGDEELLAWWERIQEADHGERQQMIDEFKPETVIAFPGGRGTRDAVRVDSPCRLD